jgi:hypothetical protein
VQSTKSLTSTIVAGQSVKAVEERRVVLCVTLKIGRKRALASAVESKSLEEEIHDWVGMVAVGTNQLQ